MTSDSDKTLLEKRFALSLFKFNSEFSLDAETYVEKMLKSCGKKVLTLCWQDYIMTKFRHFGQGM